MYFNIDEEPTSYKFEKSSKKNKTTQENDDILIESDSEDDAKDMKGDGTDTESNSDVN